MNTAHFMTPAEGQVARLLVRDDRGTPITERELPSSVTKPAEVDDDLRAAGWVRSADWTNADDGWVAPVVAESEWT